MLSKYDVIQLLKEHKSIITAYKPTPTSNFFQGSKVVIYQEYQIRTISNQSSPDNLDNLPKF